MRSVILEYNNKMKENLDKISQHCSQKTFEFKTSNLVQYNGKGTEKSCPIWQDLGLQFQQIYGPVVYWFQFNNDINPQTVFDAAKNCKHSQDLNDINFRHLPAMKDRCPEDSSILYVGACATTKLIDRMFWHFGYYKTGKTQGLQLCHWSRDLNLEMTLNVLYFPQEAKDMIYIYEKLIANQLNPLLGK